MTIQLVFDGLVLKNVDEKQNDVSQKKIFLNYTFKTKYKSFNEARNIYTKNQQKSIRLVVSF